jgi:hypothetical protein
MTTATKTCLAISVAGFIAGSIMDFCSFQVNPMFTAILPVGAIFLGMFLISLILEKEVAQFDAEQTQKLALARQPLIAKKTDNDL